jgi:hypothetical protein
MRTKTTRHPITGRTLLENRDVHEFGDFALTRLYERRIVGSGYCGAPSTSICLSRIEQRCWAPRLVRKGVLRSGPPRFIFENATGGVRSLAHIQRIELPDYYY